MKKHLPPKLVVLVVYKKSDKKWRGFCAPFDITCEAKTIEEAKTILEDLVECYMEGLKQYGFPEHLTIKELSNLEDKKIFAPILKEIAKKVEKMISSNFYKYVESSEPVKVKKPNVLVYSFHNNFAKA